MLHFKKRHPRKIRVKEITDFLTFLAVEKPLGGIEAQRAPQRKRLPVVLTMAEVRLLMKALTDHRERIHQMYEGDRRDDIPGVVRRHSFATHLLLNVLELMTFAPHAQVTLRAAWWQSVSRLTAAARLAVCRRRWGTRM